MSDSELEDLLQSSDDLVHKLDLQEVDDLLAAVRSLILLLMFLTLALRWSLLQRLLRGFYKTSSCLCVMPQEMRWKHQPQDLLWLHPTGAPEKRSFQKAGGQQDPSWLTLQLHEKMWKPTCANSVRAIPLLSVAVIAVHAPSSVPTVMSACTPDTPSTTEMAVLRDSSSHCPQQLRYVPVEIPEKICGCPTDSLRIKPGKSVAVITMNGRHELSMPELACSACKATWTAGVEEVLRCDYWPATLHFATIYETDVFFSFEDLKMAAPGLSCQAFLKMLDQRTIRFGRIGKISGDSFLKSFFEWEAVRYEVDSLCKEEPFTCRACSPDMLAVSVDGNRKHYRFKNAARSEEQAIFNDVFIAKDEDVTGFVNHVHSTTKHVSGRGVCGGEWSAARETSQKSASKLDEEGLELAVFRHGVLLCALNMYRGEIFAYPLFLQEKLASSRPTFFCMDVACKYWPYLQKIIKSCPEFQHLLEMKPFLSVFHAKAHDFKCEIKWSGALLEGAGLTLGEEVEQVNAFVSRIAVTTKHMSKAGRNDMLTLMAMRWNEQKMKNLATYLSCRYLKTTKALDMKTMEVESMKAELAATDGQFEDWVRDVKWKKVTTTSSTTDAAASLARKIETLVVSVKRLSQRLYKEQDSNKGRARTRRKIREEKGILTAAVQQYNGMVPSTETLCFETILSEETAWPWQLPGNDSVDLRTKRRVFDGVMAERRLREEKKILVLEMNRHWRSLTLRGDSLKELICSTTMPDSQWALTVEGMKGLQSIAKQKLHRVREMMALARQCYLKVLTGAENVLPIFSDVYSDSDSVSDLEDLE